MNHRFVLSFMLTMALLAGCGSNAETIETWAKHLEAGDYDQAKAMMINPSYDWQEATQRQLKQFTWKNYKIFDMAAAEQTAMTKGSQRVQWEVISPGLMHVRSPKTTLLGRMTTNHRRHTCKGVLHAVYHTPTTVHGARVLPACGRDS